MNITYLGHSSFKLDFKSTSVVTDPFDKEGVGLKFPKTSAELVTISHDHFDHNKVESVEGVRKVFSGPGEYDASGISFTAVASFHDDVKGEERGKNTIFVIEAEELRICHLGDLGHSLSDKQISQIGDVDVLMIPVGGTYTLDSNKASEVARSIEADIIMPMHYKVPGMLESFSSLETYEDFVNLMGVKVEKTKKFSLKKGDLIEEDQKIVIFES